MSTKIDSQFIKDYLKSKKKVSPAVQAIMSQYLNPIDENSSSSLPTIENTDKTKSVQIATNDAIKSGANPLNLALAKKQLGNQEYIGYCQAFVADTAGGQNHGASAIEAWNNQQDKAVQGLNGISPGDEVYFAPDASNGGYGHTGIYSGDNRFISATNNGIQQNDLGQWQQSTGQQILGYIPQGGAQ